MTLINHTELRKIQNDIKEALNRRFNDVKDGRVVWAEEIVDAVFLLYIAKGVSEDAQKEVARLSLQDIHQFSLGSWECKESPTGQCVYTNREYDSCIFCYEPDERK